MKTKDIYVKPAMEEIEILIENTVMVSSPEGIRVTDEDHSGRSGAKQKSFWD